MGDGTVVDVLIRDGLWCAFEQCHMGNAGELVAEKYGVSREAQDAFAAASHQKAAQAAAPGDSERRSSPSRFRRRKARLS